MNKQHNPDEILNSLKGAQRAEPRPYLLTRVNAAIAAKQSPGFWSRLVLMLQKPAVAFTLIAAVILFNLSFFLLKTNDSDAATALIQKATTAEFAINVNSIYDVENLDQ